MIRFLLWLVLGLPIGFVLVSMAVSSADEIVVRAWPLTYALTAPAGLVLMAVIVVAFFAGMIVAWIIGGRARARMRAQRRQIEDLRDQIAATHARLGQAMASSQGTAQEGGARRGLPRPQPGRNDGWVAA